MSRTSSRESEHGSETGLAKTEAPADAPGDAAPKEMRTVFIHVNFIKVGEINTVKETFDAEIVIKARWRAAGLDGLATYVKLEDEWRPQLYIENSVGETLQKSSLSMERNAQQETFLVEKMKFRGSYIELMELWDFPFDVQELSILIKSETSINETELVDETQEIHKIHKRSFMDEQEFYLYKTIDSSVAPPTIDQQLGMVTQRKANLKVTINVARLPHYFIWNMFLLMNIIVIVAFNSFAIDSSRYLPNRVTLCLVLVLSAVTFKNVVNAHIPKISHFTYLDAYLLIMMILLAFICGWHALMTRVPVTNVAWVDMVGLIGFAVFYIIFHTVFIALIITKPYSRRYQMQLKEQEYLMALSRKEIEELKPRIERVVESILGFNEPTLVTAAINCLDKGYSKRDAAEKLGGKGGILEFSQASKFAEQLFNVYDTFHSSGGREKSKKRKTTDDRKYEENDSKRSRRADEDTAPIPEPGMPSPGQLTADKIKEMMANARLTIQERKAQLSVVMPSMTSESASLAEAQQRQLAEDLQSRIQVNMAKVGMTASNPVLASGPMPVILDEEGRTIDAKTGQAIQLQHHTPTLKANIRAKKREQFKAVHERPPEEISESKFFDSRLSLKGAMRSKRSFKFHEKGKFEQLAQRLRNAAQLEKLQNEIAQVAKKTGIASAAKFATIQPKSNMAADEIPELEWWDSLILKNDSYSSEIDCDRITNLVEHPIQMKAPAEPTETVKIAVMLTKKERKKLRRQNRTEAQKEEQEKIRLGLMPPPEPKVRMANLMRVLGTEAVQDPTKVEAHVRAQMAKRQRAHEEANATRKLTKDQKREKKMKKIKEDTSLGVYVTVYRVRDLTNPSKKFKVETNAKQLFMTGIVVLHKECNVVVVEGGPKQQKKFNKLVLHRMKWNEEQQHMNDEDDEEEEKEAEKVNYCKVVWEGTVKKRSFGEITFKTCPVESFAREQFKKHGVEQYWDLAYNSYILETAVDES